MFYVNCSTVKQDILYHLKKTKKKTFIVTKISKVEIEYRVTI